MITANIIMKITVLSKIKFKRPWIQMLIEWGKKKIKSKELNKENNPLHQVDPRSLEYVWFCCAFIPCGRTRQECKEPIALSGPNTLSGHCHRARRGESLEPGAQPPTGSASALPARWLLHLAGVGDVGKWQDLLSVLRTMTHPTQQLLIYAIL